MRASEAVVQLGELTYRVGEESCRLQVGSPAWFAWLAEAEAFHYESDHGSFTARKEAGSGGRQARYWKAYRKRDGRLHRAYLGRSEDLTPERLAEAAAALAGAESAPCEGLLLTTKLTPPAPRPDLVPRERLIQRLDDAACRAKLTLVSATAGAGKTTLLYFRDPDENLIEVSAYERG